MNLVQSILGLGDMTARITAHVMVKNEGRWLWYSIMSVIDHVDKMIIFDTGSCDHTVKIVQWFLKNKKYFDKITFVSRKIKNASDVAAVRNKMLEITETEWFMVVDGDEIYPKSTLAEALCALSTQPSKNYIAFTFVNCVGDAMHRQFVWSGKYSLCDIIGNISIRIYKTEKSGVWCGDYNNEGEGLLDNNGYPIDPNNENTYVVSQPYLHMSHTFRSNSFFCDLLIRYRWRKIFTRIHYVVSLRNTSEFPEVFYEKGRPEFIKGPFKKAYFYVAFVYFLGAVHRLLVRRKK